MGTHAADYLETTLSQGITVNEEASFAGLRIRFIVKQLPAGTFTLSIKQGATVISSVSFTSTDLRDKFGGASSSFWGDFSFPERFALNPGQYTAELSSSGYTFGSGNWLAWAKTFSPDISGANPFLDFSGSVYYLTLLEERNRGLKYDY